MWPIPSGLVVKACAGLALLLGVFLYGLSVGISRGNVKQLQAQNLAQEIKQKESVDLAKRIDESRSKYDEAINTLHDANAKLIAFSLRNRANRQLPGPRPVTCAPATGNELAREDAEFLIGFAGDADKQTIELERCYRDFDTLRNKMLGKQ